VARLSKSPSAALAFEVSVSSAYTRPPRKMIRSAVLKRSYRLMSGLEGLETHDRPLRQHMSFPSSILVVLRVVLFDIRFL